MTVLILLPLLLGRLGDECREEIGGRLGG